MIKVGCFVVRKPEHCQPPFMQGEVLQVIDLSPPGVHPSGSLSVQSARGVILGVHLLTRWWEANKFQLYLPHTFTKEVRYCRGKRV